MALQRRSTLFEEASWIKKLLVGHRRLKSMGMRKARDTRITSTLPAVTAALPAHRSTPNSHGREINSWANLSSLISHLAKNTSSPSNL
jgi:hypothetical protein